MEEAGKDQRKEDESYDKSLRGVSCAGGELKDPQWVADVAQEQLCNSRDRHDKDFLEMQETMLKVTNAQRFAEIAQEQVYDPGDR